MQKFVAYYRVSTKAQGQSGLGLDAQRDAVKAYLVCVSAQLVAEFTEVEHATRKGNHRPQLAAALSECRIHRATLIIAKLDRLARNVAFVSHLMESGCEFTACDFPQANRLTIHVLAAVAEHEAEMISTRTRAALAAAKRKGTILGGDRGNAHLIWRQGNRASAEVRRAQSQRRANDLLPMISVIRSEGATSLRLIAEGLNRRGIVTARGREWSAAQVYRILKVARPELDGLICHNDLPCAVDTGCRGGSRSSRNTSTLPIGKTTGRQGTTLRRPSLSQ
jgi:DNA invertase Pin-like site-specific DNA recombinase